MKIQEAIQQKTFANEQHKLRANILHTASWLNCKIKDFLNPYDITAKQFNILRILRGQHPQAIGIMQIRDRMIDKMSDTSRLIERLQKKGLVEKKPSAQDKRQSDVRITPQGLSLLAEIDGKLYGLDEATCSALTDAEAAQLNGLLDKLRNSACE
jgi:MarR family multiple gene transcriptional regulator MgrA